MRSGSVSVVSIDDALSALRLLPYGAEPAVWTIAALAPRAVIGTDALLDDAHDARMMQLRDVKQPLAKLAHISVRIVRQINSEGLDGKQSATARFGRFENHAVFAATDLAPEYIASEVTDIVAHAERPEGVKTRRTAC